MLFASTQISLSRHIVHLLCVIVELLNLEYLPQHVVSIVGLLPDHVHDLLIFQINVPVELIVGN